MKRRRKTGEAPAEAQAVDKLGRLLETEASLETMLARTRQEAQSLVEAARAEAETHARQFEADLEAERLALRRRIDRETEETIDKLRRASDAETAKLAEIGDEAIDKIARRVVDLVIGHAPTSEPP